MVRWLFTIFIIISLGACVSPRAETKKSPPLLDPSVLGKPFRGPYPFVLDAPQTAYYLTGPQQARPPDGSFKNGMRLALVLDAGSYSLVTSESGITAYVPTSSLRFVK
jgi:hypothetical protein